MTVYAEGMNPGLGWTDQRVDVLKKLWVEGFSASQIAKQLGGITRNAVIGKVTRLGLNFRAEPADPTGRQVRQKAPPQRGPRPVQAKPRPLPQLPPIEGAVPPPRPRAAALLAGLEVGSATVLTLGAHMCKWPIGDPTSEDFAFCGRPSGEGVYCEGHAQVAYMPAKTNASGRPQSGNELARSLRRYI